MPSVDEESEDAALIRRLLDGDAKAFEILMESYYVRIGRLASHILGDSLAAEDIAQEVFLRAYQGLSRFRGDASLLTWLSRITVNLCVTALHRRRARSGWRGTAIPASPGADASAELALLRSQVNPHFLFNTLNNIDALIRKDPEKASDSVLKLSGIMRYFIYEANTDKVPLQKEIDYLESFIDLQRLRYRNTDFILYTRSGNSEGLMIAPMLFVPFVENAFKHGTRRNLVPGISINLAVTPGKVRLEVWNYFEGNMNGNNHIGPGIGLANVEKRLHLLYPDKHKLEILKQDDRFSISLEIITE